jgi:periplasmic protein TonB
MKLLPALLFTALLHVSDAKEEVFRIPSVQDNKPEFIGGQQAFYSFLSRNFKYPERAIKARVNGKIFVRFRVTKKSVVDSIQVIKCFGFGSEKETIRVLKLTDSMWKPGQKNGVPTDAFLILPITICPE